MKKILLFILSILFCNFAFAQINTEDKGMEEEIRKMMAFSDKFKNSLKNCTPDSDTIEFMGMKEEKIKIIGKEKEGCHITIGGGFHILLNGNELSISGYDELMELLDNKKDFFYDPFEKSDGIFDALIRCEAQKKFKKNKLCYGGGIPTFIIQMGPVSVSSRVDSTYENGLCQIFLTPKLERNSDVRIYSLRCDIPESKMLEYLKPYQHLNYKVTDSKCSHGSAYEPQIDKDLMLKMHKEGFCKKSSDFPPINSAGCPDSEPLKGSIPSALDWDDKCRSCDEITPIRLNNLEECTKVCNGSERRAERYYDITKGECIIATCPKDKPLKDEFGRCHPCDSERTILLPDNCSMCSNRTIRSVGRVTERKRCVISDCTNRPLLNDEGICYPCTTGDSFPVEKGKCTSICPNRIEKEIPDSPFVYCEL